MNTFEVLSPTEKISEKRIRYISLILEYLFWGLEFNYACVLINSYVPSPSLRESQSQVSKNCLSESKILGLSPAFSFRCPWNQNTHRLDNGLMLWLNFTWKPISFLSHFPHLSWTLVSHLLACFFDCRYLEGRLSCVHCWCSVSVNKSDQLPQWSFAMDDFKNIIVDYEVPHEVTEQRII